MIRDKISELSADPKAQQLLSAADYLLLFKALTRLEPATAMGLYRQLQQEGHSYPAQGKIHPLRLIDGLLLRELQAHHGHTREYRRLLQEALITHGAVYAALDPTGSGLLPRPKELTEAVASMLGFQCFWTANTEALLQLAAQAQVPHEDLLMEHEILIHETNDQLWDEQNDCYQLDFKFGMQKVESYLPLWASIPAQDQAEALLSHLRKQAPPWTSQNAEWFQAEGILILEGLQNYEMLKAAGELQNYLLYHAQAEPNNWRATCISICFTSSSAT